MSKIIGALERGQAVVETATLTREELLAVLEELKSIMAVYQDQK